MRLTLYEAPTQKEQHRGQPQHLEIHGLLFSNSVGSLKSHNELINMEGIVRQDLRSLSEKT